MIARMKITCLLVIYFCFVSVANAQTNLPDSLATLLAKATNDSSRSVVLEKAAKTAVVNKDEASALKYLREILAITQKNKWKFHEA